MCIIPHFYVLKGFEIFEILKHTLNIKVLRFHILKIVNVFLVLLIGVYHMIFLPSK
jgi:hypothetical protein